MLGVLLVILNGEEEEEVEDWQGDGYEDNITATYGAVAAAPNVANMAYPSNPEISSDEQISAKSLDPNSAIEEDQTSGPPIPAEGLPEGWTMEQWIHYGQEWLNNNR